MVRPRVTCRRTSSLSSCLPTLSEWRTFFWLSCEKTQWVMLLKRSWISSSIVMLSRNSFLWKRRSDLEMTRQHCLLIYVKDTELVGRWSNCKLMRYCRGISSRNVEVILNTFWLYKTICFFWWWRDDQTDVQLRDLVFISEAKESADLFSGKRYLSTTCY